MHRRRRRLYAMGEWSPAVKRPRWYVRGLKQRPQGIASRGPWRERRQTVEDALRLDAYELYGRASAYGGRLRVRRLWRGLAVSTCRDREPVKRGSRIITVNGVNLILTPGHPVPFTRTKARTLTAKCPDCGGQFRYLYLTHAQAKPQCRTCAGLIYRSQTKSAMRRARDACERCRTATRYGKPHPRWDKLYVAWTVQQRLYTNLAVEERRSDARMSVAQYKSKRARERAEAAERKRRVTEQRREARQQWREYVSGLGSRREQDSARMIRRIVCVHARMTHATVDTLPIILTEVERRIGFPPGFPLAIVEADLLAA